MKSPFPYFGGKSKIAAEVWRRFGQTDAYIEPFAGSIAVLLSAPRVHRREIINDADGLLVNFWRALQAAPDKVAKYATYPAYELDLHARHRYLTEWRIKNEKLFANPEYYDPKMAGWWVWGISNWLGGSWCTPTKKPPKRRIVKSTQGIMTRLSPPNVDQRGTQKFSADNLAAYLSKLAARLFHVKVLWGEWDRAVTPVMLGPGSASIFLDPPYLAESGRDMRTYSKESGTLAHAVREWAIANGDNPRLRIALCGLEVEHAEHMPGNWPVFEWASSGGYGAASSAGKARRKQERVWFSPHCFNSQLTLF